MPTSMPRAERLARNRLMTRSSVIVVGIAIACATQPQPIGSTDLTSSGIAIGTDSSAVIERLGSPATKDSLGWHYHDLAIVFESGKVAIISLTGPSRATARGLRVGDLQSRALALYSPCYSDSLLIQICYSTEDFDDRAITIPISEGRVSRINMGRLLEP